MNIYLTELRAEDPKSGHLKTWCGPNVPGITIADAQAYCERNGMGYLKVIGELLAEIPWTDDEEADKRNTIDYQTPKLN